jgi:hypothetical protein
MGFLQRVRNVFFPPRARQRVAFAKPEGRGPGLYVLLYNYPPRHRDRRLKSFAGPFSSRTAAAAKARAEKAVWYPVVRKLRNDPFTLGL